MMSALFIMFASIGYISMGSARPAYAQCGCCECGCTCSPVVENCSQSACECQSNRDTPVTIQHITDEFIQHREWIIKTLWEAHVLPAMMHMTNALTATTMQQTMIIGSLFDAKHQLETQRLLQQLQAQAHKDYHPSKGMCEFGTSTRSLAASSRNSDLTQIALAARSTQRQLLSGDGISAGSSRDDSRSRLKQFKETYCNPNDFANGLVEFCEGSEIERYNKDVNFAQTIDMSPSLEIDFSQSDVTDDEEDVLALAANLYGPKILPRIPEDKMASENGDVIPAGAAAYMKTRALAAKRSVAQAAFAAQAAMRAQGGEEVFPYLEAILKEMGIQPDEIETLLGERPSYHAQMEILTKKLYQTPSFYTELYDKPTNVDRKNVSMQAIGLMQKRDIYRSQLRSEAMMAVWLETNLKETEDLYTNELIPLDASTKILELQGLE